MDLVFTRHALRKMEQRHISRADVESILTNPRRKFDDGEVILYDGNAGGRVIRVVVARDSDPLRIITAYPRRR